MPTATQSRSYKIQHSDNEKESENSDSDQTTHEEVPKSEAALIYEKVVDDATFIVGDTAPLMPIDHVNWLNLNLIQVAMAWFQEYIGLYAATTIMAMLTLAVSVKPISTLIFCDNKPMNKDEYFRRFLGKLRGTEKFFNVLLEPVEMRKVFYKTRKLHTMAMSRLDKVGRGKPLPEIIKWEEQQWMRDLAKAVRDDVATIAPKFGENYQVPLQVKESLSWGNTQLPFNQFGMVYFTAAFFGPVWQRPQLFGMKDRNDIKMQAVIHMWAVIANLLGLQDEFNIYINPDPEVIDRVCRDVYIESLGNIDTVVVYLQDLVAQGITAHMPLISHKQCLCFALQALDCPKRENIWNVMGTWDKVLYKFVEAVFWLAGNNGWFRHFTNWLFKRFIYRLYRVVLDKPVEKYQE